MTAEELLARETFLALFEITDPLEREERRVQLELDARNLRVTAQFNTLYKAHKAKFLELTRQGGGNLTCFSGAPLTGLKCGDWTACDLGVWRYDQRGNAMEPQRVLACPHPILPAERLVNADDGGEKLRIAYFKDRRWQSLVAERSLTADKNKIVRLADRGVEVTTETSRGLVRYLADVVALNTDTIPCYPSIARFGWMRDGSFVPYHEVRYDGDDDFRALFAAVTERGDYALWREYVGLLRQGNRYVRILLAASFASVLLEPLGILPFVVHLWGGTGAGKTVGLMVAMSVWGDPELGRLVRTLNMTGNAMARTAAFLYNIPFAGDELQVLKQRWNNDYDAIIMHLCEGIDRGRARACGGVEDTRTWRCAFLLTGEEPIAKASSGGGARNRCLQIEVEGDDRVVENGRAASNFVRHNYGGAGRRFVEALKDRDLSGRYQELYDRIMDAVDTEGKQAMAAAVILLADEIACEAIWQDDPMEPQEVLRYLASAQEVDAAARAYDWTVNWLARNEGHFTAQAGGAFEVWGRLEQELAVINRDVLRDALRDEGFDYAAVMSKWAQRGQVVKNSQGRSVHSNKVSGIKAAYVRLRLQGDAPEGSACPF